MRVHVHVEKMACIFKWIMKPEFLVVWADKKQTLLMLPTLTAMPVSPVLPILSALSRLP